MTRGAKADVSVSGISENALCARVQQLVTRHTLSVVAERTGTPVSSVHRYVNGGRIPGVFCAALSSALAVNPGWLMTGEGAVYGTDVGGTGVVLAAGMRELVDAMTAVSRLKLGAVSGRKDLRLLSELSEATARHSELRDRLGKQIEPVAREWLAAFRGAMERRDGERADELAAALEKLLAFTDDPVLRLDFDRHKALHHYVQGRRVEAAALQRRNLLTRLAETGEVTEQTLRESYNLCAALSGLGRMREGKRFAAATLALRGQGHDELPIERMLRCMLGLFELSLGDVAQAVARITAAHAQRGAEDARTSEFLLPTMLLRTGAITIRGALLDFPLHLQLAVEILRVALLREDRADIELVLDHLSKAGLDSLGTTQLFLLQARWVLAALSGRQRRPSDSEIASQEKPVLETPLIGELEVLVLRCQRARLSGQRNATALALQAHEVLASMPDDVTPDVLVQGMHARNLRLLARNRPKLAQANAEATRSVAQLANAGFGLLRGN